MVFPSSRGSGKSKPDNSNLVPGLDVSVKALAADVEKVMVSLYDYQKALGNEGDNDTTESLRKLRPVLKDHWNNLRERLQACHAFATDVFIIKELGSTEAEIEELKEILRDMKMSAEEQQKRWKDLKNANPIPSNANQEEANDDKQPSAGSPAPPDIKDPELKASVNAFFAAAFPRKDKSSADLIEAFTNISTELDNISKFWSYTKDKCESYLGDDPTTMTRKDAKAFTEEWKKYQKAIEEAIVSITKTNVAILVEPTVSSAGKRKGFFGRWW